MTDKPTKSGTAGKKGVREGDVAFQGPATRTTLKVRKIGNSLGVVLPAGDLARQNLREGDEVILSHTSTGLKLDVYDPEVAEQVEAGREIARRYRNTLRELAK